MSFELRPTPKTSEDRLARSSYEVNRNIISESGQCLGGSDSSPRSPLRIKHDSKEAALVPKVEQSDLSSVLDRIGKNAELIVGSAASGQVGVRDWPLVSFQPRRRTEVLRSAGRKQLQAEIRGAAKVSHLHSNTTPHGTNRS